MASWAKNQIAKHLARFAKNIEPSQISLKFLRGEGELLNLELNEQVLTDLLELPPWLQLKKATCNRIFAKIHWTSLKTDPIRLFLDCVEVEIYASEEARQVIPANVTQLKSNREKPSQVKPTKYGFAEKVVDGMFVSINTVLVNFKASGFKASFSMSKFIIQSTTADWEVPNNLRKTRIKDDQRGQVLIFKEIQWRTMRLDADAAYLEASQHGSVPLRLITNNSVIRLTIKKRLSDCSLVSSRLEVILDDLLWVLTQSQLLKLSSFVHFILKIRQKFLPLASHSDAPRTTTSTNHATASASSSAHSRDARHFQGHGEGSTLNQLFTEYDVQETSYHVRTKRIDLHLCDDQTLNGGKRTSPTTENGKGRSRVFTDNAGALLISINNIRLDHYPYHIAGIRRKVPNCDEEATFCRRQWAQQLFDFFLKTEGRRLSQSRNQLGGHSRRPVMHESFFLVSCSNFAVMEVTTNNRQEPKSFLSSDKETLFLPPEMNSIFLDFTSYYYLGNLNLPVPPSNLYMKLNPIQLTFHPVTCVWLNKFIQSVIAGFEWTKEFMAREIGPPEHLDLRIEALMPKVTIPCETDPSFPHQEERPKALQIQISQAVISNSRIGAVSSQSDLLMDVQNSHASKLHTNENSFPNSLEDIASVPNEFWVNDYSMIHQAFKLSYNRERSMSQSKGRTVKEIRNPRLIWCIWCEQIWLDFIGIENSCGRPVTFVDAVPLRMWISLPIPVPNVNNGESEEKEPCKQEQECKQSLDEKQKCVNASNAGSATSTTSLPSALGTSQKSQFSLGQASSSSSMSVGSPECSNSINSLESISTENDGVRYSVDARSSLRRNTSELYVEDVANHPLRTSYSETDLLPNEHLSHIKEDSISLQEYKLSRAASPFSNTAEPPPPYCADSSPSHSPSSARHSNSDASVSSLPPSYGLPPAYETLTTDEGAFEAPPLPTKTAELVSGKEQLIKDFFRSESQSNSPKKTPTIGALMHIVKSTNIQLDHFQLVFIIRLQEMFAEVMQKIAEDTAFFQTMQSPVHKEANSLPETAMFSLHLSIPAVDVNIILPPSNGVVDEQRMSLDERIKCEKITRFFDLENARTASHVSAEVTVASDSPCSKADVCQLPKETEREISESPVVNAIGSFAGEPEKESRISSTNMADGASSTECLPTAQAEAVDCCHDQQEHIPASLSNDADDSSGISCTSDSPLSSARDPKFTLDTHENRPLTCEVTNPRDNEQQSMNEHVSKVNAEASTQTDVDGRLTDVSEDQLVSVVCLKCVNVSVGIQSEAPNSLVKVTVDGLNLTERGNLQYNMTLDHRLTSTDESVCNQNADDCFPASENRPCVMVRLTTGPDAEKLFDGAGDLGYAHIKVNSINASLLLSNAESLSEFVEDEFLMPTLPFTVEIEDCNFKLLDDKARRYLSSPLPPPLAVLVKDLKVCRSTDGGISIKNIPQKQHAGTVINDAVDTNCTSALDTVDNFPDARFHVIKDENVRLLQDLKLANARMLSLEEERNSILKVVEKLQNELMWSNHENEKLANKLSHYKQYIRSIVKH